MSPLAVEGLTPILLMAAYLAGYQEMKIALTNYGKTCRVMKVVWIKAFLMHILRWSRRLCFQCSSPGLLDVHQAEVVPWLLFIMVLLTHFYLLLSHAGSWEVSGFVLLCHLCPEKAVKAEPWWWLPPEGLRV